MHPDAILSVVTGLVGSFQVHPGRYRLVSTTVSGGWYVKSATVGGSNLFEDELVVGPGAAGSTIQLLLSHAGGRVHGMVRHESRSIAGWVVLIPMGGSLVPCYETPFQPDGTFSWAGPPGRYEIVALDRRLSEDIGDPEVRGRLTAKGRVVEVAEGSDATVDLQAPESVELTESPR